MPDTDPPLPRIPDDPDHIARLRREAMQRMDAEGREPRAGRSSPATVYGGPPPGPGIVTRRWTLKWLLLLVIGLIAALTAIFFGTRKIVTPVYGGPPPPPPKPEPRLDEGPKPLYGAPAPQVNPQANPYRPQPSPASKPHTPGKQ